MDNKIPLNINNNDTLNQNILEQAILLKMTSEIRAFNIGIIPKMDVVKKFHSSKIKVLVAYLESKIVPFLNLQGCYKDK